MDAKDILLDGYGRISPAVHAAEKSYVRDPLTNRLSRGTTLNSDGADHDHPDDVELDPDAEQRSRQREDEDADQVERDRNQSHSPHPKASAPGRPRSSRTA